MATVDDTSTPDMNIGLEKLWYIIVKAREFDAEVEPVDSDPGSSPSDDGVRVVLEDYEDGVTLTELRDAIDSLNDDEVVEVIALVWLGRGDFSREEWEDALALARERHTSRSAEYLVGTPNLGDCLEEGAAQLGFSFEDYELNQL
jgi:hypothetical protein